MPANQPLLPKMLKGRPPSSEPRQERKRRCQEERRQRQGLKAVTIELPTAIHEVLKSEVAARGQTLQAFLMNLINEAIPRS